MQGEYHTFAQAFANRSMVMFEIEGSPNITGQLASSEGDGACLMAQASEEAGRTGRAGRPPIAQAHHCSARAHGWLHTGARPPTCSPTQRGLGTLTVKHTGVSGGLPPCIFSPRMAQVGPGTPTELCSTARRDSRFIGRVLSAMPAPLRRGLPPTHAVSWRRLLCINAPSPPNTQLYLDYNALSGSIPDAFDGAQLLNLFQADHVRRLGGRVQVCLREALQGGGAAALSCRPARQC